MFIYNSEIMVAKDVIFADYCKDEQKNMKKETEPSTLLMMKFNGSSELAVKLQSVHYAINIRETTQKKSFLGHRAGKT
jgi:hypothetical protein